MHKIHAKPFELADFSTDHMTAATLAQFRTWVDYLEQGAPALYGEQR